LLLSYIFFQENEKGSSFWELALLPESGSRVLSAHALAQILVGGLE
jgi:hypothetical protein